MSQFFYLSMVADDIDGGTDRDLVSVQWLAPKDILIVWRTYRRPYLQHHRHHLHRHPRYPLALIPPPRFLICRQLWVIHPTTRTQTASLRFQLKCLLTTRLSSIIHRPAKPKRVMHPIQHQDRRPRESSRNTNVVSCASASLSSRTNIDWQHTWKNISSLMMFKSRSDVQVSTIEHIVIAFWLEQLNVYSKKGLSFSRPFSSNWSSSYPYSSD